MPATKAKRRRSRRRALHCGGCGKFIGRDDRGRPAEHVARRGGDWVYVCQPVPPHEHPPPMDVPLPLEGLATYRCQVCDTEEDAANAQRCFPLCTTCEENAWAHPQTGVHGLVLG